MKTILVDAVDAFVVRTKEGGFEIFEPMFKMMESFPHRKIILTGANDKQFYKFGLDKMPYEVFTLKYNPEKVEAEYYRKMLENFNLTANEVVYFEHNPEAVASAQSVGINTYHWDNDRRPLEELKIFLKQAI